VCLRDATIGNGRKRLLGAQVRIGVVAAESVKRFVEADEVRCAVLRRRAGTGAQARGSCRIGNLFRRCGSALAALVCSP